MVKNKIYVLLGLLLSLGNSNAIIAMEKDKTNAVQPERIDPFFNSSCSVIPQYVYENCNQVTCHTWQPKIFALMKEKANNDTEILHKELKNLDKEQCIKRTELYDWIHGLCLLQSTYTMRDLACLTVKDIQIINAHLTRLIAPKPGEFRERNIKWNRYTLTDAECVFASYLDAADFNALVNGADPYLIYNHKDDEVSAPSIEKMLNFYKNNRWAYQNSTALEINTDEVKSWVEEKSYKKKRVINRGEWAIKRMHFFPEPENIKPLLEDVLNLLKDATLHPIELAARVWYEIIRIHPWHEANKRAGKALASLILLKHGYLPPIITEGEEYTNILIKGFNNAENGYKPFLEFIARLVQETQHYFRTNPEKLLL